MDLRNHPATVAARRRIDLLVLQTRLHIANHDEEAAILSYEKAWSIFKGWADRLDLIEDVDLQADMADRIWPVSTELTFLTDGENAMEDC